MIHSRVIASYRYSIAAINAVKIFLQSLTFWPLRIWWRFWLSRAPEMQVPLGNMHMILRTNTLPAKIVDLAMAASCIVDDQYLPKGFALNTQSTIIDIGGHIGSFAIRAADITTSGQIFVYEPDPDNFKQLEKNIRANQRKNIRAYNVAITSTRGSKQFFRDHLNCAESGFFKKGHSNIMVPTITLEDVFRENNITSCDLLKIDCEGSEYDILLNAPDDVLKKIQKISMELHSEYFFFISSPLFRRDKLLEFLRDKGFSFKERKENKMHSLVFARRS